MKIWTATDIVRRKPELATFAAAQERVRRMSSYNRVKNWDQRRAADGWDGARPRRQESDSD